MKRSSHQTHPPATSSRPPSAEAGGPTSSAVEANAAFDLAADSDSDGEASNHLPGSFVELGTQAGHKRTQEYTRELNTSYYVKALESSCVQKPVSSCVPSEVWRLALESVGRVPGCWRTQVFALVRAIKALHPTCLSDPRILEPAVREWYSRSVARRAISDHPFDEVWTDFTLAWSKVKYPKGALMNAIVQRAKAGPLPKCAERYDWPELQRLAALCRELQREAGHKPFFLSCRTAAELLSESEPGMEEPQRVSRMAAWTMLFRLQDDGILEKVESAHAKGRRATEYRYRGDWEAPAGPAPATAGPGSEILL